MQHTMLIFDIWGCKGSLEEEKKRKMESLVSVVSVENKQCLVFDF
jgi:hypothetical protein